MIIKALSNKLDRIWRVAFNAYASTFFDRI